MAFGSIQSMGLDINKIASETVAGGLKSYLNSLYPSEFEYYLFNIELMDRLGNLKESLLFPVMPNAISESRTSQVNIKKTNNSVISLTNRTFTPTVISISGTFGKKIRILFSSNEKTKENSGSAFAFSAQSKNLDIKGEVKTGYGVTKLLERIILRSQSEADSLLFMYNLSLGNNYLVECTDFNFAQSLENNMLWNYSVNFKSLARAEDVYPAGVSGVNSSIKNLLAFNVTNKLIGSLITSLNGIEAIRNESLEKIGIL